MAGGRPPKPSHLKLVSGTTRSHKKGAKPAGSEPQPQRWQPGPPPAHLSPRAGETWAKLAPMLDRMGVLTVADEPALGEMCEAFADILEARASLATPVEIRDKDGVFHVIAEPGNLTYTTRGKEGYMIRNRPEHALLEAASRRFHGLLGAFGLTPASRSKIVTVEKTAADPLDAYFGG